MNNLSLPFAKRLFHIKSTRHVMNLISQDNLNLAKDQIRRIRNVIVYIFSSLSRIQTYHQKCKKLGLR